MSQPHMDQVLGIVEPPDGFTPEEKLILQMAGEYTVESIYAKLPTSRMKALVALHFECGYSQEMLLNSAPYAPYRQSGNVGDLLKVYSPTSDGNGDPTEQLQNYQYLRQFFGGGK